MYEVEGVTNWAKMVSYCLHGKIFTQNNDCLGVLYLDLAERAEQDIARYVKFLCCITFELNKLILRQAVSLNISYVNKIYSTS